MDFMGQRPKGRFTTARLLRNLKALSEESRLTHPVLFVPLAGAPKLSLG